MSVLPSKMGGGEAETKNFWFFKKKKTTYIQYIACRLPNIFC